MANFWRWGQQLQQRLRLIPSGIGWRGKCFVDEAAAVQAEGQGALDVALLRQQHPTDIGVGDDRDFFGGVATAGQRPAL
jgi:hypothetical protein